MNESTARFERQNRWDTRYLKLAQTISSWSKDPSTKVGAVLVRANNSIASTGFNGFPPGEDDDPRLYANREYKYQHVVHAERNALNFAGAQDAEGGTLYTSFPCCPACALLAAERRVKRIVMPPLPKAGKSEEWTQQWEAWVQEAILIVTQRGVTVSIRHV